MSKEVDLWRPRKIFTVTFNKGGIQTSVERVETKQEISDRVSSFLQERERELERMKNSEPLMCDVCGKEMGYVYSSDLNMCRFYHKKCLSIN